MLHSVFWLASCAVQLALAFSKHRLKRPDLFTPPPPTTCLLLYHKEYTVDAHARKKYVERGNTLCEMGATFTCTHCLRWDQWELSPNSLACWGFRMTELRQRSSMEAFYGSTMFGIFLRLKPGHHSQQLFGRLLQHIFALKLQQCFEDNITWPGLPLVWGKIEKDYLEYYVKKFQWTIPICWYRQCLFWGSLLPVWPGFFWGKSLEFIKANTCITTSFPKV